MNLMSLVKRAETEFFPWVIEAVVIEDDAQLKNMSDLLGIGKRIAGSLESARKAEKQPHLDNAKAVDDRYKPQQSRVQLAVGRLDSAVLAYYRKKKAEAEKEPVVAKKWCKTVKETPWKIQAQPMPGGGDNPGSLMEGHKDDNGPCEARCPLG